MSRVLSIPYMLWAAVGMHTAIGMSLIASPDTVNRLLVLSGLNMAGTNAETAPWFGLLLLGVSAFAAAGLIKEDVLPRWAVLAALTPQYLILLASLVSDLWIIADGTFNGNPFDRWAAIAVLCPVIVVALLHTMQILDRYALRWHTAKEDVAVIRAYRALTPQRREALKAFLGLGAA